ncbi:MAG: TIGR03808 family TAT-translocated repetitive protein [Dongiaceae bacterium]
MDLDRRSLLSAGLTASAALAATAAAAAGPRKPVLEISQLTVAELALNPKSLDDQTAKLQAAIDDSATSRAPLHLPAGTFRTSALTLRPGSCIAGAGALTKLEFTGGASFITGEDADGIVIEDLAIDGAMLGLDPSAGTGLISLRRCQKIQLRNITISRSLFDGIALAECSGRIADCSIVDIHQTGVLSLDAKGLEIARNRVIGCGNNGIQVWRTEPGEDGSIVSGNRVERIAAKAGGTGQNGNGISVFRAGGVLVTGNRVADCAYSAIRANAASNIQMVANSCARLGEVALYAEFGFEGALIASNIVDTAASGIVVTNFNEGGRLGIVQGNLVRNLFRREFEIEDKRGIGISIEADSLVTGNTVEGAPTAGIQIGWAQYMRDCAATQNLIRNCTVGILITAHPDAGSCLIAQNMISGATEGAIRAMRNGLPTGPDLAREGTGSSRVKLSGNVGV